MNLTDHMLEMLESVPDGGRPLEIDEIHSRGRRRSTREALERRDLVDIVPHGASVPWIHLSRRGLEVLVQLGKRDLPGGAP